MANRERETLLPGNKRRRCEPITSDPPPRRGATLKRRRLRNPKTSNVKRMAFVPPDAPHVPAARDEICPTLLLAEDFAIPET